MVSALESGSSRLGSSLGRGTALGKTLFSAQGPQVQKQKVNKLSTEKSSEQS